MNHIYIYIYKKTYDQSIMIRRDGMGGVSETVEYSHLINQAGAKNKSASKEVCSDSCAFSMELTELPNHIMRDFSLFRQLSSSSSRWGIMVTARTNTRSTLTLMSL